MIRFIVVVFVFQLYLSCGYMFEPAKRKQPRMLTLGDPKFFKLEDTQCQYKTGYGNFSQKVEVNFPDAFGNLKEYFFDFSAFSMDGLKSSILSNTFYFTSDIDINEFFQSNEIESYVDLINFSSDRTSKAVDHFKNLRFCRRDGGYRRESLENAALSVLASLKIAHDFYESLHLSNKQSLKTLKIIVLPRMFEKSSHMYVKNYLVDNAFWIDLPSSKQIIAILPHSKKWSSNEDYFFWEVPGVSAHEFGHHVFYHYANKLVNYKKNYLFLNSTINRIIDGFNEGFADLFSYYALKSYKDINPKITIEKNRDIESSILKYQRYNVEHMKHFNRSYIKELTTEEDLFNSPNNVDRRNFLRQEIHQSGAIMAYTFNRLLDAYGFAQDHTKKMEILIEWIKFLDSSFEDMMGMKPVEFVKTSLKNFIKIVNQHSEESSKEISLDEIKKVIKEVFPAFSFEFNLDIS